MNKLDEELERQRLEKATQKMLRQEVRFGRFSRIVDRLVAAGLWCAACTVSIALLILIVLVIGGLPPDLGTSTGVSVSS